MKSKFIQIVRDAVFTVLGGKLLVNIYERHGMNEIIQDLASWDSAEWILLMALGLVLLQVPNAIVCLVNHQRARQEAKK